MSPVYVYTGETHRTPPLKEYKTIVHHEELLNTPPTKTSKNRGELDLLGVPEEEKTQRKRPVVVGVRGWQITL